MNNIQYGVIRQQLLDHIKKCLEINPKHEVVLDYYNIKLINNRVVISLNSDYLYNDLSDIQYDNKFLVTVVQDILDSVYK